MAPTFSFEWNKDVHDMTWKWRGKTESRTETLNLTILSHAWHWEANLCVCFCHQSKWFRVVGVKRRYVKRFSEVFSLLATRYSLSCACLQKWSGEIRGRREEQPAARQVVAPDAVGAKRATGGIHWTQTRAFSLWSAPVTLHVLSAHVMVKWYKPRNRAQYS